MNAELAAAIEAWEAWDSSPARRDRVVDLEAALAPIAERLRMTTCQLRDAVTLHRRHGVSAEAALAHVLEPDLFDDDGRPRSVTVPTGGFL